MRIADADCLNRFLLAPMCDVTSWPYRALCRELGAGLVMTEMVSSVALAQAGTRSLKLMEFSDDERPVGVQISACPDVDAMETAARMVEDHGATLLNLNCGCPVKKVIKGGSGSAMMKEPEVLRSVVRRLRAAVSLPLTVKIRAGWDARHVNAVEIGRMLEDEGVDSIMIHARTREQKYEGHADWQLIKDLVDAVSVPVVGNGDVFEPADGIRMLEQTGCAGVMVGRAAMGNPWIFRGLLQAEAGDLESPWRPDLDERLTMIRRHFERYLQWSGERGACLEFRKQLIWYTHDLPEGRSVRRLVKGLETRADFERILSEAGIGRRAA